ncbi:hypothetical protein N431DRAFT_545000 [Stipitochalara longipes BDJ]|nr:hypothetical protein N431DRAFT_545000 [Stipitochalara longipes BDJ]
MGEADKMALKGGPPGVGNIDPAEVARVATDMQKRCRLFLDELEQFQTYLKGQKKENQVELRTFKSGLQTESRTIDKLAAADPTLPKTIHGLRTTNLPFFEAVWSTAKTCTSLTALNKRFYWRPGPDPTYVNVQVAPPGPRDRAYSTLVDVVAQGGLEWVKVSSVTEKRIIWDLAKAGWVAESSGEESEDVEGDDDLDPEGLQKQAEALVKACQATRVRYQHPKIRLVLPNIKAQPSNKVVANLLRQIRNLGITIQTADDMPPKFPAVTEVLSRLDIDPFKSFSETLNVDCSILLAFASDVSHGRVEAQDWHNKIIARQIEMEHEDQVLPNSMWPACAARKLICTREAAEKMEEIVHTMGTETEKRRAALLLGKDSLKSREQSHKEFQKLSDYQIPPEWNIPIEIVEIDMASVLAKLPPVAKKVSEIFLPTGINRSVFLFGWSANITTISSNATAAKDIEMTIEEENASSKRNNGQAISQDNKGPYIWICPFARSLVGKEKTRRGAKSHPGE